jgi:hypothetical protein
LKADDGFATVEALMATVVLVAALAYAQGAYIKARQAADVALELRLGRELAAGKMVEPLAATGRADGDTSAFRWRLQLAETGQPGRVAVCRRTVRVESRQAPTRRFELSSLEPCPPKAAT